MISWKISQEDATKIDLVLLKCIELGLIRKTEVMHHNMNLTACHGNGCPLDFDKLLTFDKFNLSHDLGGIDKHINKQTGKIEGFFLPRCSAEQ